MTAPRNRAAASRALPAAPGCVPSAPGYPLFATLPRRFS